MYGTDHGVPFSLLGNGGDLFECIFLNSMEETSEGIDAVELSDERFFGICWY